MRGDSITIREVAQAAGVSKTTAAYILTAHPTFQVQETTRRRVLNAAARLGYRRNALAAALSSGRLHTLGVVIALSQVTQKHLPSTTYFKDMIVAIADAAARAGLRMTLVPFRSERFSFQEVADQRVDGLITVSLNQAAFIEQIYAAGIPFVEIGTGFGARSIRPDNEGGSALAVDHLAALGHRRIAHLLGDVNSYTSDRRAAGFRAAVERHDLDPVVTPAVTREELARLLSLPAARRPTAVFAFNDQSAFNVLDIAREIGLRVPDDLSVVGFDNNSVAEMARPTLTTIENPLEKQAEAAVTILQSLWRGETEPFSELVLPTELIQRQSTAAPEAASPSSTGGTAAPTDPRR